MDHIQPGCLKLDQVALFLDVDGTLLDLAPRPDAVTVPSGLGGALRAAARRVGDALALVSGRPIAELDRLFAPLHLAAAGVHGSEIRYAEGGSIEALVAASLPQALWHDLLALLRQFRGTLAENKTASFAVHYRQAAVAPEVLAAALKDFIDSAAGLDLRLTAGLCVFEIRLPGFDKGRAIREFMARSPFLGRIPVFIADDPMDCPGFEAARTGGGRGFSVGASLPGVEGCFASPRAVREWLETLSLPAAAGLRLPWPQHPAGAAPQPAGAL